MATSPELLSHVRKYILIFLKTKENLHHKYQQKYRNYSQHEKHVYNFLYTYRKNSLAQDCKENTEQLNSEEFLIFEYLPPLSLNASERVIYQIHRAAGKRDKMLMDELERNVYLIPAGIGIVGGQAFSRNVTFHVALGRNL